MRYCIRCRNSGRDCGVHDVDWMISKGTPSGTDSRDRKISFPGTSSAVYSDVSSCPISLESLEKIDEEMPDDDVEDMSENVEAIIVSMLHDDPEIPGKAIIERLEQQYGTDNPKVAKVIKKMIRRQRRRMAEKGCCWEVPKRVMKALQVEENEVAEDIGEDLIESPEDESEWEEEDFEEQLRENEKSLEPYYLKNTINLGNTPIEFSDLLEKAAEADTELKSMKDRVKLANTINGFYAQGYFPQKTLSGRASKYVEQTCYELTGES